MSLRRFFAMLIAVAMTLAPLAMLGGAAMAAPAHPDHGATINQADHCGGKAGHQQNHGKSVGKSCCAAMCVAVAVAPASTERALSFAQIALRPSPDPFRRGYLGEIATPPPRPA